MHLTSTKQFNFDGMFASVVLNDKTQSAKRAIEQILTIKRRIVIIQNVKQAFILLQSDWRTGVFRLWKAHNN